MDLFVYSAFTSKKKAKLIVILRSEGFVNLLFKEMHVKSQTIQFAPHKVPCILVFNNKKLVFKIGPSNVVDDLEKIN